MRTGAFHIRHVAFLWVFALGLVMPNLVRATILTFDNDTGGGVAANMAQIPQAYGDNVTSPTQPGFGYGVGAEGFTPHVTVAYGFVADMSSGNVGFWNVGYGDRINIAYNSGAMMRIHLTATAPWLVALYEFDMAAWSSPRDTTITIFNEHDQVLYSSGTVSIPSVGHSTFDFTSSPLISNVIKIEVVGPLSLVGIDNIRFGQVIPEPGAVGLTGLLSGWLAMRRRTIRRCV